MIDINNWFCDRICVEWNLVSPMMFNVLVASCNQYEQCISVALPQLFERKTRSCFIKCDWVISLEPFLRNQWNKNLQSIEWISNISEFMLILKHFWYYFHYLWCNIDFKSCLSILISTIVSFHFPNHTNWLLKFIQAFSSKSN